MTEATFRVPHKPDHGHHWKVVPMCGDQMRDINRDDVIDHMIETEATAIEGHPVKPFPVEFSVPMFRRCHTYKGGGGYDQFPKIAVERDFATQESHCNVQFVVQLMGCPLDCPYCYVTREGVWGQHHKMTSEQLVDTFVKAQETHGVQVFHLMGGAPALQLRHWPELINRLDSNVIFHSDLMLVEGDYQPEWIEAIDEMNVLLAVNIKGLTAEEWEKNTRKPYPGAQIDHNLRVLNGHMTERAWYLTFTGINPLKGYGPTSPTLSDHDRKTPDHLVARSTEERIAKWCKERGVENQTRYHIDLIDYEATAHVDNREWGIGPK